ncbi:unnamed protein product [Caenorhabditis brenneri]
MPHTEALETEQKSVAYVVPDKRIDGGLICKNGNFSVDHGLWSGANFAILDVSNRDALSSKRLAVGNFGANCNISSIYGVDMGVDWDLLRATFEMDRFKIGTGLSYSTGIIWQEDVKKLVFLGYGIEYGADGAGFRTPTFDLKIRWW